MIRLDTRTGRLLVIVLTLLGAAVLARVIVSPVAAAWRAGSAPSLADLESAATWDAGDPDLRIRLGQAYQASLDADDWDSARRHLVVALRRRPSHAFTWLRVATLAGSRGEVDRANRALEVAVHADRHNVILRWEAALLALRLGDRRSALEHLRYVLDVDSGKHYTAFQLLTMLRDPADSVESLLPARPEALTGLFDEAVGRDDVALAEVAWERRAAMAPSLPVRLVSRYVDLLVREGHGLAARRAWTTMFPDVPATTAGGAIWNGGFEGDVFLGWGLAWRLRPMWGVDVEVDRAVSAGGRQSLRLAFNALPSLDFSGVYQMVPVEPHREYRLQALVRAAGFTTRSGLRLEVVAGDSVLAETAAVTGTTTEWIPLTARVPVPTGVSLVRVRLRRERAGAPEGNLAGKVWVDDVRLTPAAMVQ